MTKRRGKSICIKKITPTNEPQVKRIEELVDKILAANASASSASNPQADTSKWEREIDNLVYSLYGLNEEEIKIIVGANDNLPQTTMNKNE
ncbi:hypothetical protein [Tenuifilum thalassicum]|uniref:Uncharacterized protein n=1 Tax=Tenuifilum thalassicum TaxID=2590900 RepID=A0A7D4BC72_9BACT|nr:hypothetical protein [Tenuifilum thalassicum]QKG80620.1 hypothetical protein FHG85_10175 [Tenuifilum thalassicum]